MGDITLGLACGVQGVVAPADRDEGIGVTIEPLSPG
jgi:hypothetical protein